MSERNDWTVFTLAGRVDDKVYIIDYRRMRSMGNLDKIEALCELLVEWNLLEVNERGSTSGHSHQSLSGRKSLLTRNLLREI